MLLLHIEVRVFFLLRLTILDHLEVPLVSLFPMLRFRALGWNEHLLIAQLLGALTNKQKCLQIPAQQSFQDWAGEGGVTKPFKIYQKLHICLILTQNLNA